MHVSLVKSVAFNRETMNCNQVIIIEGGNGQEISEIQRECKVSCATFVHVRYGDRVWRPLDFLCSIQKGKKRPLQRVTGKFCGRRDSSLRCSRSNQRFPASDHPPHDPSSSSTMNPKADDRTIDPRARSIRRYARGELRQSSSTAHHNFRLARSIPRLKNHLLFANHSLQPPLSSFSSSFTFFLLLLFSLYLSFCCVVVLLYFSSYAQFCVLLPPVTLAENNNNICSLPTDKGRR